MNEVVSPRECADSLSAFWSPRIIGEVDDAYVKVAKIQGTLTWHSHDQEDELFLVLKGSMKIEMRDRTVHLNEGDMFVVPKGVEHNPIAENECQVLLFERKTTQHTGDVNTARTRTIEEQWHQD